MPSRFWRACDATRHRVILASTGGVRDERQVAGPDIEKDLARIHR